VVQYRVYYCKCFSISIPHPFITTTGEWWRTNEARRTEKGGEMDCGATEDMDKERGIRSGDGGRFQRGETE
jgi:hypothetical protein